VSAQTSTASIPPAAPRRLKIDEVKAATGLKLGEIILKGLPGSSVYDVTFPKRVNGTYAEHEVTAWTAAQHGRSGDAPASLTPQPPPANLTPEPPADPQPPTAQ
jgi:hypothetical protein